MEAKKRSGGSSWETEATLYEQAQGGCSESLMGRHEGLVRLIVQRQWQLSLSYEEALQAGRAGLWRAILGYNPGRGTTFAAYAYPAIMRYVWAAVKAEKRRKKREIAPGILVVYCYRAEPGASLPPDRSIRCELCISCDFGSPPRTMHSLRIVQPAA
jgi:hypothetical protein